MKKQTPANKLYKYKNEYAFLFVIPGFYESLLFSKREMKANNLTPGHIEYFGEKLAMLAYSLGQLMINHEKRN